MTICVKDRKSVLGGVIGEIVKLSALGSLVNKAWRNLEQHYQNIELDEFIVMPNHVHGIIWIHGKSPNEDTVGEGLRPSPTDTDQPYGLPEIICAFKSFSARAINAHQSTRGSFWQRGYHEHIIRNYADLNQHRAYIRNNPLKWALDEYYA